MKKLLFGGWIFVLISGLTVAHENYKDHPGYIDLSEIEIPNNANEIVDLNIPSEVIDIIKDDSKIHGSFCLNVKIFDLEGNDYDLDKFRSEINKIEKKLSKDKWSTVVRVKKGDESTHISVKFEKNTEKVIGLMMISFEPGNEAVFVNLAGSITLKALKDLDIDIDDEDMEKIKASFGCEHDEGDSE